MSNHDMMINNDDQINTKFTLTKIIVSSCVETTAHGISPILKREHIFIRLFWTVCLLVSTGVCAYMVALSITAYFDYETVTKVEKIYLLTTDFPAVSICNKNSYATNASLKFIKEILLKNEIFFVNNTDDFFRFLDPDKISTYKYFVGLNALDPDLPDQVRQSFGYNMSEMMLTCSYNFQKCSENDFHWFYDVLYGNCYTFNSGNSGLIFLIFKVFKSSRLWKVKFF